MTRTSRPGLGLITMALATMVAGAIAVPPRTAAGATQPPAAIALQRAERDWRRWLLADRPDLATRYGVRGGEDRLVPLGEAGIDSMTARLARVRESCARVDRAALGRADSLRFATLESRLDREWRLATSGAWRADPQLYCETTLDAVLEAAAKRRGVSPCERSRRATRRLREVPEALRAAMVNLRGAREFDREATLLRWNEAIQRLRVDLPATLLACREPHRVAEAVEADSAALDAAQRFVEYVRDDLVQSARKP